MKGLLFLAITLGTFTLWSQTIEPGEKAKQVIKNLSDFHLKPRALDSTLSRDIHDMFISNLDNDLLFLTKGDSILLAQKSARLIEEIQDGDMSYLNLADSIIKNNSERISSITEELFNSKIDYLTPSIVDEKPDELCNSIEELKSRWSLHIISSVQRRILNVIENDSIYDIEKVASLIDTARILTQQRTTQYLQEQSKTDRYLTEVFLNSVVKCYDPHTSYFNPQMRESFEEELTSNKYKFGISYQIELNGDVKITNVLPGSSAWFSESISEGMRLNALENTSNDRLNLKDIGIEDIASFFNDLPNDSIYLEILESNGEINRVGLERSLVYSDADVIKSAVLNGSNTIGYISLPDFYTNWTDTSNLGCANDVAKSLLKLKKQNVDGMIIDLRYNGGGSVKEAIDLIGIFIDYGPVMIQDDYTGDIYSVKDYNRGSIYNGPLIVMINSYSASASEIVAGTLQDYNRALIVGQTSYGKATGQIVKSVDPKINPLTRAYLKEDPDWGYLKVTDLGLYRIDKSTAQGVGVVPDVALDYLGYYDPAYESDYDFVLKLDSIEKKMYYKTLTPIDGQAIQVEYNNSKSPYVDSILAINVKLKELSENYSSENNLENKFAISKEIDALILLSGDMQGEIEFDFVPASYQFDDSVLEMSPFLNTYKKNFLENLLLDVELNETFKIFEQLIKK